MLFRDKKAFAEKEIATEVPESNGTGRFASLAALAFGSAVDLVMGRREWDLDAFAMLAARLYVAMDEWKAIPDKQVLWRCWPEDPKQFGRYHRVGDSALHTALLFAQSIANATEVAKVLGIGVGSLDDTEVGDLARWPEAFADEIETRTLDLSSWSMPELHRDAELLYRQIQLELKNTKAEPEIPPQFEQLANWASENMGQLQFKYLSILMKAGGKKPLQDLAVEMGWYDEQVDSQQSSKQKEINGKMAPTGVGRKQPYKIERKKNIIYLSRLGEK